MPLSKFAKLKRMVIGFVVILWVMNFLYRIANPTGINHIILISNHNNNDSINGKLIVQRFNGKKILDRNIHLPVSGGGHVIHFDHAWLGGELISVEHDGVEEHVQISSAGRYPPTLFIEINRGSPSLAGWDQIPSIASRGKTMPSGELNGVNFLYTFESSNKIR